MKVDTNNAGVAKCFSNKQLKPADTAWLVREARKCIAWDRDAYSEFEDMYLETADRTWLDERVDLLLTTDAVTNGVALALFLRGAGFPEDLAKQVADAVVQARKASDHHPPFRTEVDVVLTTNGPANDSPKASPCEVNLCGPMNEQLNLALAVAATPNADEITRVVQTACLYVANQCARDAGLNQAFLASDWAQGLSSAQALRFVTSPSAGATSDSRTYAEVALLLYLNARGFEDSTADVASRLADAWAGTAHSFGDFLLKTDPNAEDVDELHLQIAGGAA
jgi:hypothetical protein